MNERPEDPARHPDWRATRFGRAAATYHGTTPVQKEMATLLVSLLPDDFRPRAALELGCGTGHLTRALLEARPGLDLWATDLSEAMLDRARSSWDRAEAPRWQVLDGRAPELAGRSFDLVASGAMVQWFPDLGAHFQACRKLVGPGGVLLVSGFSDDHFPELEAILGAPPFSYPPGPGHSRDRAAEAATAAGWEILSLQTREIPWTYPSGAAFLEHLRGSGANRPPPDGRKLTRSALRLLREGLESKAPAEGGGVRIRWRPWFLAARPT